VTPTLVRGVGNDRVDGNGGLGAAVIRHLGGTGSEELGEAVAAFQRAREYNRGPRGGPVPVAVLQGLEDALRHIEGQERDEVTVSIFASFCCIVRALSLGGAHELFFSCLCPIPRRLRSLRNSRAHLRVL
jgi:hypothetical protein